ncbi:MAG: hypothetical protein JWN11_2331 [Hyphomicrobiales bacterium]|nr:hypothetical protein [Hyphomicrobiales bacterium]
MNADLPDPATSPELFDGVLPRRAVAFLIDVTLIGMIMLGLGFVALLAGFLTFGLAWTMLPLIAPLAVVPYYALTLGSSHRATVGMSMMDIVLTPTRGQPLDGIAVLLHPFLFWLSFWISWPVSLLFALFTPRQQMLHDLIVGSLMVRRSPMSRHWTSLGARPGQHA